MGAELAPTQAKKKSTYELCARGFCAANRRGQRGLFRISRVAELGVCMLTNVTHINFAACIHDVIKASDRQV